MNQYGSTSMDSIRVEDISNNEENPIYYVSVVIFTIVIISTIVLCYVYIPYKCCKKQQCTQEEPVERISEQYVTKPRRFPSLELQGWKKDVASMYDVSIYSNLENAELPVIHEYQEMA